MIILVINNLTNQFLLESQLIEVNVTSRSEPKDSSIVCLIKYESNL